MVNRFKLGFSTRLCFIVALMLAGCAISDTLPKSATRGEVLLPLTALTGARPGKLLNGVAEQGNYILLRFPVAVSARNNNVYIVDAGLHRIFRYDRAQQTLAQFTNLTPTAGVSIYAAPDMTVYVTDPAGAQVLHFNWDGTPLPPFSAPGHLAHPVSVVAEEGGGRVLVADRLYEQIIVFNSLGMPLNVIKPQQVRSIAAIAPGPDGIYVLDRLARQVVVLGWNGEFRYTFGAGNLSQPAAIAVSRDNLVFVGDNFDHTIKVFRDSLLVSKVGGTGAAPGKFSNIGGLAVDGNLLFITDGQNARTQIMSIDSRP